MAVDSQTLNTVFKSEVKDLLDDFGKILSSLGKIKEAVKSVNDSAKSITGSLSSFGKSSQPVDKASKSVSEFDKIVNKVSESTKKLGKTVDSISSSVEKYEKRIKNVIKPTGLFAKIIANLNEKIKQVALYGIAASAVYALISAFRSGVKEIIAFSQSLANLRAISGATNESMMTISSTIKDVARDTKFSTSEISDGMVLLVQSGLDAEEAISSIRATSELATGTLSNMNVTTDLLTTTMRSFNLRATESGRIADVMANAINKSKLTIDKLRTAFSYVGVAAKQSGVSLEQVASTMAILANNGFKASTIGTGLRRVLTGMVSPSTKMATALESQGVALGDLNPKLVGWEKSLGALSRTLWDSEKNAVNMGKAFEFFGLRGQAAAAALVDSYVKGSGNWEKMLGNIRKVGTASEMAGIQATGLGVKFKNLSDRFKLIFVSLGEAGVEKIIGTVVDILRESLSILESLVSVFGPLVLKIAEFVVVMKLIHSIQSDELFKNMTKQITIYTQEVLNATKAQGAMAASSNFLVSGINKIGTAIKLFAKNNPFIVAAAAGLALVETLKWLAGSYERVAKEAMKMSAEYDRQADILSSYKDILGEAASDYDTFSTALKRFSNENSELAKELGKVAGVKNIVNADPNDIDKLSASFQKLIDKKISESLENDKSALENLSRKFEYASTRISYWNNLLEAGKISSSDFRSRTEELRSTMSDFENTSNDVVSALAGQITAQKKTRKEAFNFIDSMNVTKKVAGEMKTSLVKSVNEIANSAKIKFKETESAIRSLPISYEEFYENMDALRKVDFITFKNKLAGEITSFRKHAISMGIEESDMQAGMAALRAKGHADYRSKLEKETGIVKDANVAKLNHIVEFAEQARNQYELEEIDYKTLQNRLVGYSDAANEAIAAGAKTTTNMRIILDKNLSNDIVMEHSKRMKIIEGNDALSANRRKTMIGQLEIEISRMKIEEIKKTTDKTISEYEKSAEREISASKDSNDKIEKINLNLLKKKEDYYKKAREALEKELDKSVAKERSISEEIKSINQSISEEKMSSDEYASKLKMSLLSEEEQYSKRVVEINKLISDAAATSQDDGRKAIELYKEAKEKTRELQDEIQKDDTSIVTKEQGIKQKLDLLEQADRGMANAAQNLKDELGSQAEQTKSNTDTIKSQLVEVGNEMNNISKERKISISLKIENLEKIKEDMAGLTEEINESMTVDIGIEDADDKLSKIGNKADELNKIIEFQNEYGLDTSESERMLQKMISLADKLNEKLQKNKQLASNSSGGGGGGGGGDEVLMASGGSVPGTGTGDIVPALLTPNEFVEPVPAVKKYTGAFMEAIRRLVIPAENIRAVMAAGRRKLTDAGATVRSGLVQRFKAGGPVMQIPNLNIRPVTTVSNPFRVDVNQIQRFAAGGHVQPAAGQPANMKNMGVFDFKLGDTLIQNMMAPTDQVEILKEAWMREKKMRSNV